MIWLLAACLSYADGQQQRGELNCQLLDVCGELEGLGFDGVDACIESSDGQRYDEADCPAYSRAAMNACLDATQDAVDAHDCDADLTEICQVCG